MKKLLTVLSVFLCLISVFAQSTAESSNVATTSVVEEKIPVYTTEITSLETGTFTTKYGNLNTVIPAAEFIAEGFEWGDVVTVSFLGQSLELPVVPTYSYVDTGIAAVIVEKDGNGEPEGVVSLAINMGNFTSTYGIADKTTNPDKSFFWTAKEGVELPITITFTVSEPEGYLAEYLIHDLVRTNERADYSNLSDEEFANFRKVTTSGIDNLYRTSNPVNAGLGRNKYADDAIRNAGVSVIMNLSDSKEEAESREEFSGSYYSTCNVIYLNLGVDFSAPEFGKGLAEGLRFFAANPGKYAVHCTEGKDRAGFVSALLECLMGASAEEVAEDYMVTYYNYYGVEKGTDKYDAILASNIVKSLEKAFGVEDFYTADLEKGAYNYIKGIGLTDAEISALKANL